MKYEIVYGEGPSSGVMAVAIGTVIAPNATTAGMKALKAIDERYWQYLRVAKVKPPS